MLNVNRILFIILGLIGLLSTSVYAFDIGGIKTGVKTTDILNKLPCKNYIDEYIEYNNKQSPKRNRDYYCEKRDSYFNVFANRNNVIWYVVKANKFSIEPNWNKILKRLKNKYGSPNTDKYSSNRVDRYLCWGNGCSGSGEITLNVTFSSSHGENNYRIAMYLRNEDIYQENNRWEKIEASKWERRKKERETSNFKF